MATEIVTALTSHAPHSEQRSVPAAAPAAEPRLLVGEPTLGEDEKAALCQVIDSGWITMGSKVRAFEQAFALAHGHRDAVAVNSCTAALHLILEALGVGPGDEVLIPSMTFVATANAVLYMGAKPVFVDIASLSTPLMSVSDASSKVTSQTRAIILMHYAGYLPVEEDWRAFADHHGLVIVEDAAHAIGIGQVGHIGDAAAFSFYGNKNMTTAEGGMVTAHNAAILDRIRQMRGHGMTLDMRQRLQGRSPHYDVTMLGFNYRMDELRAAIGLVQLSKLEDWNAKRRTLTTAYRDALGRRCPGVITPFHADMLSAYHIMPVLLPDGIARDRVVASLASRGIQTTFHYPPVHTLSYYAQTLGSISLPLTEVFARRELSLPLHPKMEIEHAETVVSCLADAIGSA